MIQALGYLSPYRGSGIKAPDMQTKSLSYFLVVSVLGFTFLNGGCALFDMWRTPDNIKLDTQDPFSECLKICYDSGTQTRNSYSSCLDGCGRASKYYPLRDALFPDFETCQSEVTELKANTASNSGQDLCKEIPNQRKRQGCIEGVRAFHAALTADNVCLPLHETENNLLAPPQPDNGADDGVHVEDLNN